MPTTLQIDLEFGAERSFIEYLSGNVVELTVAREESTETIVALIKGSIDEGSGLQLRRFDEDRGQTVGDTFVVGLDDVRRIAIY